MTQVTAPSHDPGSQPDERRRGFAWLQRDEGWARGQGAARLALAVLVALGSVGLKLLVVRGFGGELGYLSYVGAVALGAWIAGLRGGLITTGICAIAEVALFTRLVPPAELVSTSELFRVGLFLFDGVLVSVITSGLRRATYRERLARDAGEAAFSEALAARRVAAIAYDNERRVRQALEHGQERLRFLADASDRLGLQLAIGSGLDEVARLAVPALADWCAIELLDLDRPVLATAAADELILGTVHQLAAIAPRGLGLWLVPGAAENGPTIAAVASTTFKQLADPRALDLLTTIGTASLVVAPILGDAGAAVGSVVLASTDPDRFGDDDLALARDLASRVGVAADQARLFGAVDRFKATVDVSGDAVYMFDPATLRLTYVNRGGAELLAIDPSALLGTSVLNHLPEGDRAELQARLDVIQSGRDKETTFTGLLVRSDRREIPVDAFLQVVTLPDGGTTAILSAHDVSERIDVQARLTRIASDERRQAAELRAVIQAMSEGILVAGHDGTISLANDAAAQILVDMPDRLSELTDRLGLKDLDGVEHGGHDAADGGPLTASLTDGRWVEVATYPADLGGSVLDEAGPSRIIVLRDVTRARDAEAAREAFLGVLSHELRTPVTTIFGYAKVLRRSALRRDRDAMLADIEIEADRLYRIVEDLLALSRVERGIAIEGEPLLLQHIAGAVVGSEAQRWSEIRFETELPPGLPPVFGERTYVEQVLRNMVANAGKYSPPETLVTVRGMTTPTEVRVEVLDRGPGVQPDEAERLFDLYYRSPTTSRTAAGAGIGLYVSRGLITAMGGRVWANARSGGGSVFGFSLLRCDEEPVAEPGDRGR